MKNFSRYKWPLAIVASSILAFVAGVCLRLFQNPYSDIALLLAMFLVSTALAWSSFILLKNLKKHPTTL
jgi:hypothetical protein